VIAQKKQGTESARAVAAAQPFLQQAREVRLVTVGDGEAAVASLEGAQIFGGATEAILVQPSPVLKDARCGGRTL
jgi:hypothetical protein